MTEVRRAETMKATAQRDDGTFRHTVQVRDHQLTVDEPHRGRRRETPARTRRSCSPRASPSCTAITMEMYAARKGWDIGQVEVEVEYTPAERGCPTKFEMVLRLPEDLPEEQVERLQVIAAKCPVHRALDGEVMFHEHVAARRRRRAGVQPEHLSAALGRARRSRRRAPPRPCSCRCCSSPASSPTRAHPTARRPAPPRRRDLVSRRPPRSRGRRSAPDGAARGRGGDRPRAREGSSCSASCRRPRRSSPTT